MPAGALVLQEFRVEAAVPAAETPVVVIRGRQGGLIAWLLTLIGIDATTRLDLAPRSLRITEGSFFGRITHVVPITEVSSVDAGYRKPAALLFAAGFFLLMTLPALLGGAAGACFTLLVAAILLAFCFLRKTLVLVVGTTGGVACALAFQRSLIEGVALDREKALAVVDVPCGLVLAARGVPPGPPAAPAPGSAATVPFPTAP